MMANALVSRVDSISIYSSAPRKMFKRLDDRIPTHLVPAAGLFLSRLLRVGLAPRWDQYDIQFWDRLVAAAIPRSEIVIGFAVQSLATGRAAHAKGARFVLDRACPHVDFQQQIIREESERVGVTFLPEPAWYRGRQLAEYELADLIICPSRYSARSFPDHLQHKVKLAPLMGRARSYPGKQLPRPEFTVGVVGGDPLRKGYIYLLEAWKKLALPNARLLIRCGSDMQRFPAIAAKLAQLQNVELVDYVPDMADFYARCDAFVLPSVDDGFGMALFEAMINGIPTISTHNCGASELVTDGVDGLVVGVRDPEQLGQAMLRLYEDKDFRHSIAEAGRATAERVTQAGVYQDELWRALCTLEPAPAV